MRESTGLDGEGFDAIATATKEISVCFVDKRKRMAKFALMGT